MKNSLVSGRRGFLKTVALAGGAAQGQGQPKPAAETPQTAAPARPAFQYPRTFSGRQLALLAFPLGGIAAGSVSLGGRGQLRDWEIFNRADKGRTIGYAFPGIWAQVGNAKPVARVLEAKLAPPYQAASGLNPATVSGLARLDGATFTGEYPLATVAFRDRKLPVKVTLEAFTPVIPLEADDSGLPVAVLRYRVKNPNKQPAKVSIVYSLDNPVGVDFRGLFRANRPLMTDRVNEVRSGSGMQGLFMTNPKTAKDDPMAGSMALCVLDGGKGEVTYLARLVARQVVGQPAAVLGRFHRGWKTRPRARPAQRRRFDLSPARDRPGRRGRVHVPAGLAFPQPHAGVVRLDGAQRRREHDHRQPLRHALRRRLAGGRVHRRQAPRAGKEHAAVPDRHARNHAPRAGEGRRHGQPLHAWPRRSASAPPTASSTASKAPTTTAAAASATAPTSGTTKASRSTCSRRSRAPCATAAFGLAGKMDGVLPIRVQVPDGKQTGGITAIDGRWARSSARTSTGGCPAISEWLRSMWPNVKKAMEFAWVKGGWDADRDGVFEGVQHNTYDVEFYGPNPLCGIYYLGGLRACEEMARAVGEDAFAENCRALFNRGSKWIDENLFNGEFYIQKVQGIPADSIAKPLRSRGGAEDPEHPDFQVGEGCLVDQLVGQYVADGRRPRAAGRSGEDPQDARVDLQVQLPAQPGGARFGAAHLRAQRRSRPADLRLRSRQAAQDSLPVLRRSLDRLRVQAAALMMYYGMEKEGLEIVRNTRLRYDGERRNPWDELECGHHYARAMAAWSGVLALNGFRYHAAEQSVAAAPKIRPENFSSFWSTGTGWGTFSQMVENGRTRFRLSVLHGKLPCRTVDLARDVPAGAKSSAALGKKKLAHELKRGPKRATFVFAEAVELGEGDRLDLEI